MIHFWSFCPRKNTIFVAFLISGYRGLIKGVDVDQLGHFSTSWNLLCYRELDKVIGLLLSEMD
jgi:hypothetical protein